MKRDDKASIKNKKKIARENIARENIAREKIARENIAKENIDKENIDKKERVKLEWMDYIALFIAALETIAIPFILLIVALLAIYFVMLLL